MLLMFISLAWKAEFLLNFISGDKNPTKAARSVLIGGNMALMGAILEQDVLRLEKKICFGSTETLFLVYPQSCLWNYLIFPAYVVH